MISRDEIRAHSKTVITLPRETINVPEWGGEVCVREMTALERDRFERVHLASKANGDGDSFRARLCVATVCDDQGAPLFKAEDVEWLANGSSVVLDRVSEVALRLNGFTKSDVDELEKN